MRLCSFVAAAAVLSASLAAHADTVYTYTGHDFTSAFETYTTSDSITGSFTLTTQLGGNLSMYGFTPESYSFSDGVQTLTPDDSTIVFFYVDTDANGMITGYRIDLDHSYFLIDLIEIIDPAVGNQYSDVAIDNLLGGGSNQTPGSFSPGVSTTAVTPEPSSIALLGTGMLGVAGVVRKRSA